MTASSMFEGLLVLDLSQVYAGPLAARLMAEGGATVVKIERPEGDLSRNLPWQVGIDRSGYFIQQNRGKLALTLDLKSDDGQAIVWRLIERADVIIDGFSPGVLARLGFAREDMVARNPRLIVCEFSALGRTGKLGDRRGYDPIGAAYSGVAYTAGSSEGGMPVMPQVAMGDAMMGLCGYGGIVSALYEREKSGLGQVVDVSLVDAYIQSHANNLEIHTLGGGQMGARSVKGQNPTVCPSGPFAAPDGRFLYLVALSSLEWTRLCERIERPEMIADPRYATASSRATHRDDVLSAIQGWIDKCGDRDVAVNLLTDAGVSAAPVLSIAEVTESELLLERGTVERISDPVAGEFVVPGPPFRLSRSGRAELSIAPTLGEHNEYVLRDILGLDDDTAAEYLRGGAFSRPDTDSKERTPA